MLTRKYVVSRSCDSCESLANHASRRLVMASDTLKCKCAIRSLSALQLSAPSSSAIAILLACTCCLSFCLVVNKRGGSQHKQGPYLTPLCSDWMCCCKLLRVEKCFPQSGHEQLVFSRCCLPAWMPASKAWRHPKVQMNLSECLDAAAAVERQHCWWKLLLQL